MPLWIHFWIEQGSVDQFITRYFLPNRTEVNLKLGLQDCVGQVQKNHLHCLHSLFIASGIASMGARGAECPPNSEKLTKNQEKGKSGRKGKNWESSSTLLLLKDRAGYTTVCCYHTEAAQWHILYGSIVCNKCPGA